MQQWESLDDEDKVKCFPRAMAHAILHDSEAIKRISDDVRAIKAKQVVEDKPKTSVIKTLKKWLK